MQSFSFCNWDRLIFLLPIKWDIKNDKNAHKLFDNLFDQNWDILNKFKFTKLNYWSFVDFFDQHIPNLGQLISPVKVMNLEFKIFSFVMLNNQFRKDLIPNFKFNLVVRLVTYYFLGFLIFNLVLKKWRLEISVG